MTGTTTISSPTADQARNIGAPSMAMSKGTVVVYRSPSAAPIYDHEQAALEHVAQTIAYIRGDEFGGCYDRARHRGPLFHVPEETLLQEEARGLGICYPLDFVGGVVADPLARTKAISHGLVDSDACRPPAWPAAFKNEVRSVVLPGYAVFDADDARRAMRRLLAIGPVRLKNPLSSGGGGQRVATTIEELDIFLEQRSVAELAESGLVIEANLHRATTLSVGQVMIGDVTISYHGTQRLASDNSGRTVYGGSDFVCIRGGWTALDLLAMNAEARSLWVQAKVYDSATSALAGFMASRRDYDVVQGYDSKGAWRSGVLEASWRSGGASTAEVAAARTFVEDPDCHVVEVAATKRFGKECQAPRGADIHYRGDDPRDGPILRYTVVGRKRPSA